MRQEEGKLVAELRREGKLNTDADVDRAMRMAFRYGQSTRSQHRRITMSMMLILAILLGIPLFFAVVIMMGG